MSYDDYQATRYFRGLDGLRALSVILVIAYHMQDHLLEWLDGKSGVYIFFVLSGFLITTLLIREERSNGSVSLKSFYIRRCFRILPIYYVVLALYVVIIFSKQSAEFIERQEKMIEFLPFYLFYMNELVVDGATGFAHSWSLAIEEKFYVIWPALGFVLLAGCGARPRILVVVLSSCVLFLMSATQDYTGLDYYYLSYWMLLAGCLLALLLESRTSFERIRALLGHGGSYVVISLFLLIHFTKADIPLLFHIYPLAVAALIAVIVMGNTGLTDFLERRPLKTLGILSYGIYLIHVLATNAVKLVIAPEPGAVVMSMMAFLGSIALSAALAYGLYVTIERPCIAYGKRLSSTVALRGRTPATT